MTVDEKLKEIRAGLVQLANCCNLDGQHDEAVKLCHVLEILQTLEIACSDTASWPPEVEVDFNNDSAWLYRDHEHVYDDDLVIGPEVVGKACSICGIERDDSDDY